MRKYINIILLVFGLSFFSCEKFLEPQKENTLTDTQVLKDPQYAEGLLLRAYVLLPDDYNFETDVASDDAVTNDMASNYRRMAIGEWKSSFDPIQVWSTSYEQIYYINKFLSVYKDVLWANDPRLTPQVNAFKNALYKKRLRGESFAMRAYAKSRLLQYHGGVSESGQLLGFPIIDESPDPNGDWKVPRSTYAQSVASIFADCDSAIANLPLTWDDLITTDPNFPNNGYINLIQGARYRNRMNGNTVRALKARVALLAASPSFSASSGVTWEQAATFAGSLLKDLGSLLSGSATTNNVAFYKQTSNKEMIWFRAQVSKRTWETNNFPPSLYGNGRTNPSQNLVDAFPMANGYPITDPASGYDPANPYAGRDNRFKEYIVYDNSTLKGSTIRTYIGASQNGINVQSNSTRTGYYLRKFMLEAVNLNPSSAVSTNHVYTLFRMTELLLNYAEAANEAWGPDNDGGLGFGTAREKIAELRLNAGIDSADSYLASITTQDGMRALIRNERRISLCFEGFRFWDIRRWGDVASMQSTVKGVFVTHDATDTYSYDNVEERVYSTDQIYGPVPYNETLKYDLQQNKGW